MATLSITSTLKANLADVIADVDAIAVSIGSDLTNDFFQNGNKWLALYHTGAAVVNVTIKAQPDSIGRGGSGVADKTFIIPIGSTTPQMALIPALNPLGWAGPAGGGKQTITVDNVTGLKYVLIDFIPG